MNDLDNTFRAEFTLTILDYLSGIELIDAIFVLNNIAKSRRDSINDPQVIEAISEISSLEKQLATGNKDKLTTENIKEKFKSILEKLEYN